MRAVPAKIPVSFARDPRLRFGDWLFHDVRLSDELIESAACDGTTAPVDNDRSLDESGCRYSTIASGLDCPRVGQRLRLVPQNCDDRRGVDNHRGKPYSSICPLYR
jgi:hypothetical protein